MKNKIIILTLLGCLLLTFIPKDFPPALNADEAAFGYNAYSLAETARDEYGSFLPLRLKSFGDYKLPLYSYLSIPFVKIYGLNEFSTRLLAPFSGLGLVILLYLLALKVFKSQSVAVITLLMASVSPWIQLFANQAHETTLATVFIAATLLLLITYIQTKKLSHWAGSILCLGLALFSYHSAKVVFPFLLLAQVYWLIKNKGWHQLKTQTSAKVLIVFAVVVLGAFSYSEIKTPPARVTNLFLFSHPNIDLVTNEAKIEARFSPFQFRAIVGLREFAARYFSYFSPEFLVIKGDDNPRFGYSYLSPLNFLEYLFFVLGLYYLFRLKHSFRYLLIMMLLSVPLASSLSWQVYSLSRTHALIVAILPLSAYGLYSLFKRHQVLLIGSVTLSIGLSMLSLYFLNFHYPKRALAVRAWQAGYQELTNYLQDNDSQYSRFYITKKNGQPYIMLLFYLNYPPAKYHQQARLSAPDEYGFGQVEGFDKYVFNFATPDNKAQNSYIGYPDDFDETELKTLKLKEIKVKTETMFLIAD